MILLPRPPRTGHQNNGAIIGIPRQAVAGVLPIRCLAVGQRHRVRGTPATACFRWWTMAKRKPSRMSFDPNAWLSDEKLRSCSVGARGLWMDLLCLMWKNEEPGFLQLNGQAQTPAQIARATGMSEAEVMVLLGELEGAGVPSRDSRGILFSRRIRKDLGGKEVAVPSEPGVLMFPVTGGQGEWGLTQNHLDEITTAFPTLDVMAECKKMLAWLQANPSRRKTPRGMKAFIFNWLNRAQNAGGVRSGNQATTRPSMRYDPRRDA